MVDGASIAAAIGSLKTAADIAKGFLSLKETAAVQGKVIELQGHILAAQSTHLLANLTNCLCWRKYAPLKQRWLNLKHGVLRVCPGS
jgi:hypothetical protein